jgi:hypothetical protein
MMIVMAVVSFVLAPVASATALSANRDTPYRTGEYVTMIVASGSVIYAGAMVCENGSAKAVAAADASGYAVIGCAQEKVDNTTAYYSATKTVKVRRGVFRWGNGGSFTDANVGDFAYVSDDATVTAAGSVTYDIVAGVIIDTDSDGVWVDTYAIGGQGAASVTTLNASGAVSVGSTLTVSNTISSGDAITLTDADGNAAISAIGYEGGDATLVLDADQGDDNADTWILESEAADNDLSFVNHSTEQFKISTAGDAKSTGDLHALGGEVWLSTTGCFGIRDTTQLVFVASGVTNVVDADITH